MRLLWIKTDLLHPVDKGRSIRTFNMLRSLARTNDVTYLCLDDGLAAPDAVQRAAEYSSRVFTVPFRPPVKGSLPFYWDLVRNLASPRPYVVERYRSRSLAKEIGTHAKRCDLVVCDYLFPAIDMPTELGASKVLFQHNVEAMIWERHATIPQNPLRRAYMQSQYERMRSYEAEACRRFDHVVAVSELDADVMRSSYGVSSISHVNTGVDLEYFSPRTQRQPGAAELVFVGSMDWMPNDDGIRWFVAEVFGKLRAAIPDIRLTVVGRSPSTALKDMAQNSAGVEVTGTVPDVRPYLERATVSVVPLRVGGGTRLKIYEAMASGTPIVSTAIGAEGLPLVHGEHLLLADSPADQADAVLQLLRDHDLASTMAANALNHVQRFCSWDAIAEQFLSQCAAATGIRHSTPGAPSA
jgi:polysaccharide biosynthesis protein PslH